jgi:hypothetical protein
MIEIKLRKGIKRHTVQIFNDIDQLTIDRHEKFNKYLMLSEQIGGSWEDFDQKHMVKIFRLIEDKEKLADELKNLRTLFYNMINGINPLTIAYGCLVASVDGKETNDLSQEGLKRLMNELGSLGLNWDEVKKKLTRYVPQSTMN